MKLDKKMIKRAFDPEIMEMLPDIMKEHPVRVLSREREYSPLDDPDLKDAYIALVKRFENITNNILDDLPVDKHEYITEISTVSYEIASLEFGMLYRQGLRDGFQLAKFIES